MHPAKAIEWNVMPFVRDTHVVPSNIVLVRIGEGEIWGSEPQFAVMSVVTKLLLWPLILLLVVVSGVQCFIVHCFDAVGWVT